MQVIHYALHEMSLIQSDYSLFVAFQLRRSGIETIETFLFVRHWERTLYLAEREKIVAKIWSRKF